MIRTVACTFATVGFAQLPFSPLPLRPSQIPKQKRNRTAEASPGPTETAPRRPPRSRRVADTTSERQEGGVGSAPKRSSTCGEGDGDDDDGEARPKRRRDARLGGPRARLPRRGRRDGAPFRRRAPRQPLHQGSGACVWCVPAPARTRVFCNADSLVLTYVEGLER
jgi:hypothetical protein